jgi:predicted nucleotidyltransferase
MALTLEGVRARRAEILAIAQRHGATAVRVFGSVARGEADDESDLDLLVELAPGHGLLALCALERELSELLGCRVEAGTSLYPAVRARVMREAVAL